MQNRTALYCVLSLFGLLWLHERAAAEEKPLTGAAVAEFVPLDAAILRYMDRIHCQAAAVAVSRDGKLLYSRGFGWGDADRKTATPPDVLLRIASVSKPITAAEIKKLIRDKKIALDTKVFPLLGLKPYNGKEGDRRLETITVGQLLEHQGGWDREKSYDPMFRLAEIEKALQRKDPPGPKHVIEYMLAQPLQFAPGERSCYSNFGYCVLGRVIEHVTEQTYEEALDKDVLGPLGIPGGRAKGFLLGRSSSRACEPREVWYPRSDVAFSLEVMDAHGGWIATAPALCRFLDAYWIDGEPRKSKESADWTCFGSLPGTTAMVRQRPDGTNIAALFNNRREGANDDLVVLSRTVDAAIDQAADRRSRATPTK
jgi:CubicO group peptidase (beta-lactamase class C family)